MDSPRIIPITEFRRRAATVIDDAFGSGAPVYVTQRGYVTAVVMSKELFDTLLRASAASGRGGATGSRPVSVEPRPPGALYKTPYGLTDAETAEFLAEEGCEIELWTLSQRAWDGGRDLEDKGEH